MAVGNENNLISLADRTTEEQRQIAIKGGKKSGEVRKARKTLKEELLLLLSQGNMQQKISLSLLQQALNGNVKAFEVLRDSIGEKEPERIVNEHSPVDDLIKSIDNLKNK